MRLIGLTGPARSGKDTCADRLVTAHGFARVSFAGPIKDALIAMLGVPRAYFEDGALKEKPLPGIGRSPRYLMQTLGTEWGRDLVHQDLWLVLAGVKIGHLQKFAQGVVVTDVRFENESEFIHLKGGEVWHVSRKAPSNVVRMHRSEAGVPILPGVDSAIPNDEGIEQLFGLVDQALEGRLRVTASAA